MRWYEKAMPRAETVLPLVREVTEGLRSLSSVHKVSIIGPFAKNISNNNFRVKDVSIVIDTNIDAGDLLGIDIQNDDPLSLTRDELIDLGFSTQAVYLTKKIQKLSSYMFDTWARSGDKILHWGFVPETIEDWKDLRKQAEYSTSNALGYDKDSLHKQSDVKRIDWHRKFDTNMKILIKDAPPGWYESSINTEDDLFLHTVNIER